MVINFSERALLLARADLMKIAQQCRTHMSTLHSVIVIQMLCSLQAAGKIKVSQRVLNAHCLWMRVALHMVDNGSLVPEKPLTSGILSIFPRGEEAAG